MARARGQVWNSGLTPGGRVKPIATPLDRELVTEGASMEVAILELRKRQMRSWVLGPNTGAAVEAGCFPIASHASGRAVDKMRACRSR